MSPRETLRKKIEALQLELIGRGLTISTAESCTGGLLATYFTELSGSSRSYLGGVASYSNHAKTKLLHVAPNLISEYGAVSSQVAESMAKGIQDTLGASYGISLTGIAGPTGGSPTKPVGTIWCGLATPKGCSSHLFDFSGDSEMGLDRQGIRIKAADQALTLLLQELEDK